MGSNDMAELIKKDRAERIYRHYEGSFLDYLEMVKGKPEIVQLAHGRLYY
jgi:serine protein kinase